MRFETPPVRTVVLTVYFNAIRGLQVSHLAPLRQRWREDYPNVAELPPLRPLRRGGDEADLIPVDGAWPFPYVMYTSRNDQQMIALQSDRFVRSWSFDSEGDPYPGFDSLFADLREKFSEFRAVLSDELEQTASISGYECHYINELGDWDPHATLVGVATRWNGEVSNSTLPPSHYAGLRFHVDDAEHSELRSEISLDLEEDEAPVLGVSVRLYEKAETDPESLSGMTFAHRKALDLFLEFTSLEMQESWG